MAKDFNLQDLLGLIDRYGESIGNSRIFTRTSQRLYHKLELLKLSLIKQPSFSSAAHELTQLTELLNHFVSVYSIDLSSSYNELSNPEKYHEIANNFQELHQRILAVIAKMCATPFNIIHNPWNNIVDLYYDWYETSISADPTFTNFRPSKPRFRQLEAERITLLNQIHSIPDFDNDEDEQHLPECIKGYFAVISQSPVHIKLISSNACANYNKQQHHHHDRLYQIAYSLISIPRCDFLHRALAVSTECSHLRSFKSDADNSLQPFTNGNTIGIISMLAPFGSLKGFLSRPPDESLIDELTYLPLNRSKGGVLAPDIKISILLDICSGLAFLHSQGYLHCRLHHNNVLIFLGYRAKLTDYGISSQLSTPSRRYVLKTDEVEIIQTEKDKFKFNTIGNDPRWYAPEIVLRDINLTKRKGKSSHLTPQSFGTIASDVYGFGMIIFSVATDGNSPFFNMIWEEAVVNALYRGDRPTFPSHIRFKAIMDSLINEDNGIATQCWADNPLNRPSLSVIEGELKSILTELLVEKETRLKVRAESEISIKSKTIEEKRTAMEAGVKRIQEGNELIRQKEEEMNSKTLASERRQFQTILDKAKPRLEGWIRDNEALNNEINTLNSDITKLKNLLKESESRLRGGKNFILRHRVWTEDYHVANLISKYAVDEERDWLKSECNQKHALESLVFDLSRPLGDSDDLDEATLLSFREAEKIPTPSELEISLIFNGYESSQSQQVLTSSSNSNAIPIMSPSSSEQQSMFSLSMLSTSLPSSSSLSQSQTPTPSPSNSQSSQQIKRRTSLNDFYQNDTVRRTISGSSIHSKDATNNDKWDWDDVTSLSKPSERGEEFITISRYADTPFQSTDLINMSLCEVVDVNVDLTPSDSLEFLYLAALRGDILESREMFRSKVGYNRQHILEVISQLNDEDTQDQIPTGWSSPCHLSATYGHLAILTSLIESVSYPPDQSDFNGTTPLLTACLHGHLPIVRYLIEMHHVDIFHQDKEGMTAILISSLMGHVDIVSYLHRHLNQVDQKFYPHQSVGGSILHWACLCGISSKIEYSYLTISSRHLETIEYIIREMKCPVNIRSEIDQSTPLHWAASSSPPTRTKLKIIELLLSMKAEMNVVDNYGRNILFGAVLSNDIQLVKILIEKFKLPTNTKDSSGKTILQIATGECESYFKLKSKSSLFSLSR